MWAVTCGRWGAVRRLRLSWKPWDWVKWVSTARRTVWLGGGTRRFLWNTSLQPSVMVRTSSVWTISFSRRWTANDNAKMVMWCTNESVLWVFPTCLDFQIRHIEIRFYHLVKLGADDKEAHFSWLSTRKVNQKRSTYLNCIKEKISDESFYAKPERISKKNLSLNLQCL